MKKDLCVMLLSFLCYAFFTWIVCERFHIFDAYITTVIHTVQPGETLWSIAGKYQKDGGDIEDIREIIYNAEISSGTTNKGELYPGDQIAITYLKKVHR